MKIKDGYNGKETELIINARSGESIELWIKQAGLEEKGKETLAYMTLQELEELFKEVRQAGFKLFS